MLELSHPWVYFCEAMQLLHPMKSMTGPHTSEQSDSLDPMRTETLEELSHCTAVMCFIHPELLPTSPLLPGDLGALLCLSAHTLGGRTLLSFGIQMGRSFPEVARAAGEGVPAWFLQLAPGSGLCVAVLSLHLASGDSQDT